MNDQFCFSHVARADLDVCFNFQKKETLEKNQYLKAGVYPLGTASIVRQTNGKQDDFFENSSKYHQTLNGHLPLEVISHFHDSFIRLIVMA